MTGRSGDGTHLLVATIVFILALVALVYVFVLFPNGLGAQRARPSTITVTATGAASARPEEAQVELFANGSGNTTADAVLNLTGTLGRLNATLQKYVNGNTSMISTTYYNVYRPYNSSRYVASEGLRVLIPNVRNATAALINVSAVPNVYVESVGAELSAAQGAALRGQAIQDAVANATAQARAVSPSATLLNVTINSYQIYPLPYSLSGSQLVGSQNIASSVSSLFYSGSSTVVESVTAEFSS